MLPELDTDEGRRLTLVEECHDRWVENARTSREVAERRYGHETHYTDSHHVACATTRCVAKGPMDIRYRVGGNVHK